MRTLSALIGLALLAGCGGKSEPRAATGTPTPTPTRTPTATPTPAKLTAAERAQADLRNFLQYDTQDADVYCDTADKVRGHGIAAYACDYPGDLRGYYALFKTRKAMRAHYLFVRRSGELIYDTNCSSFSWHRKGGKTQGGLGIIRRNNEVLVMWTDDSEKVAAVIRSKKAPPNKVCARWRKSF